MPWYSSSNAVLYDNCKPLQNLTLLFKVTEDLATVEGSGFSLQLNAYPPPVQTSAGKTLKFFQYLIFVKGDMIMFDVEYYATDGSSWINGLTWLGPAPSNIIRRGSELQISLTTDSGNVMNAAFTFTDPDGNIFPPGAVLLPVELRYPIVAFQMNLVGPGNLSHCTFTTGLTASRGIFYYSVLPGELTWQGGGPGAACGESTQLTGETSNAYYSDVWPVSGPTVIQTLGEPVDCVIDNMARREAAPEAVTAIERLRQVRDTRLADVPSGLWLRELLYQHTAELASLVDQDSELSRESWGLLQKAESVATAGSLFSAELIDTAEELVQRASTNATPLLAAAGIPLRVVLDAMRGRTLEEGLEVASRTIRPRHTTAAQ